MSGTHGCYCDLNDDEAPEECVLDQGRQQDCRMAEHLISKGKGRDDCSEWRPLASTDTVAALRAEVERLAAENTAYASHSWTNERHEVEVAEARHKGRMEALDAVFQINGPSRAIARLKEKYGAEAVRP